MFWKIESKREFKTMLRILKDAENYDNINDIEVRNVLLTTLCEHIEIFKIKNQAKTRIVDGGSSFETLK